MRTVSLQLFIEDSSFCMRFRALILRNVACVGTSGSNLTNSNNPVMDAGFLIVL